MIVLPYTLSDKLKANIAALKAKEDAARIHKEQANLEHIRLERLKITNLMEYIGKQLIDGIMDGEIPHIKVTNYENQAWLKKAIGGEYVPNIELWNEFEREWLVEGIKLKIEYCHDGMGMESWLEITAKPI